MRCQHFRSRLSTRLTRAFVGIVITWPRPPCVSHDAIQSRLLSLTLSTAFSVVCCPSVSLHCMAAGFGPEFAKSMQLQYTNSIEWATACTEELAVLTVPPHCRHKDISGFLTPATTEFINDLCDAPTLKELEFAILRRPNANSQPSDLESDALPIRHTPAYFPLPPSRHPRHGSSSGPADAPPLRRPPSTKMPRCRLASHFARQRRSCTSRTSCLGLHRSHFGSRYKLGCWGHAGLFCSMGSNPAGAIPTPPYQCNALPAAARSIARVLHKSEENLVNQTEA